MFITRLEMPERSKKEEMKKFIDECYDIIRVEKEIGVRMGQQEVHCLGRWEGHVVNP